MDPVELVVEEGDVGHDGQLVGTLRVDNVGHVEQTRDSEELLRILRLIFFLKIFCSICGEENGECDCCDWQGGCSVEVGLER